VGNDDKINPWPALIKLALDAKFDDLAWAIFTLAACITGLNMTADMPKDDFLTTVVRWPLGLATAGASFTMLWGLMRYAEKSWRALSRGRRRRHSQPRNRA
jgi:hypothetical protein